MITIRKSSWTIGHVVGYKNPEVWLESAKRILSYRSDTKFVWLGEGTMLDAMRQQVTQQGYDDRVSFEGVQDNVGEYLATATIYFQPSVIENHAISIIDAMASGLPCVASCVGGTPESIVGKRPVSSVPLTTLTGYQNVFCSFLEILTCAEEWGLPAGIARYDFFARGSGKVNPVFIREGDRAQSGFGLVVREDTCVLC